MKQRRILGGAVFAAATLIASAADVLTFHANAMRTGWIDNPLALTPSELTDGSFGERWQSPELDWADGRPPRLYATPLYVDDVVVNSGAFPAGSYRVVFAATSNGFVYAINAETNGKTAAGAILWRTELSHNSVQTFDGVNIGIMSTPVIDRTRGVLYVCACANPQSWCVYALDIGSGRIQSGWPVTIDAEVMASPGINRNAPTPPAPVAPRVQFGIQRGALTLNGDGSRLYVTFGESATGWLISVATDARPRVASAFASVRFPHRSSGGIWGAGGAAIDSQGRVFVGTGANFGSLKAQPDDWTQSVLQFTDASDEGLVLRSTYTPFNYGDTAAADIDLGSGGICVLPNFGANETSTPQLMALGGKQGNVYLLNRARLPGGIVERPPVSHDSASDGSLLGPKDQPQFGRRGPLNVFGPYSETKAAMNQARSRSVPAYFRSPEGSHFLFVTGQTKASEDSDVPVAPCLARLRVVVSPGQPAYLEIDQLERDTILQNPGSPVVSSRAGANAIVWVLDENAPRTALLFGGELPQPILYAFDARDLKLLWRSTPGALRTSGKYNEPLLARGSVLVGTDRIQAFGRRAPGEPEFISTATVANEPSKPHGIQTAPAGRDLYLSGGACAACHGANGEGVAGVYPPLAGSEWVKGSEERLIRILLHGLQGPVNVAGKTYNNAVMPGFGAGPKSPFNWSDEKLAEVLTYIRQTWGETEARISAESVRKIREQSGEREAWTEAELLRIER